MEYASFSLRIGTMSNDTMHVLEMYPSGWQRFDTCLSLSPLRQQENNVSAV